MPVKGLLHNSCCHKHVFVVVVFGSPDTFPNNPGVDLSESKWLRGRLARFCLVFRFFFFANSEVAHVNARTRKKRNNFLVRFVQNVRETDHFRIHFSHYFKASLSAKFL